MRRALVRTLFAIAVIVPVVAVADTPPASPSSPSVRTGLSNAKRLALVNAQRALLKLAPVPAVPPAQLSVDPVRPSQNGAYLWHANKIDSVHIDNVGGKTTGVYKFGAQGTIDLEITTVPQKFYLVDCAVTRPSGKNFGVILFQYPSAPHDMDSNYTMTTAEIGLQQPQSGDAHVVYGFLATAPLARVWIGGNDQTWSWSGCDITRVD